MYAAELGWFDAGKLEGFADEACEILAEGDLCRWRLDYLREGIRQRIGAVRGLLSWNLHELRVGLSASSSAEQRGT